MRPNKLEGRIEDLLETFAGEWLTLDRIHHELAGRFHPYHRDSIKRVIGGHARIERRVVLIATAHTALAVKRKHRHDTQVVTRIEYRIANRSYLWTAEEGEHNERDPHSA